MEPALLALLKAYAPLTALVGARIVWGHLPQDMARPAVVLDRIGGAVGYTMQGASGLTGHLVQVDVQALTVESRWAVRDAVRARLSGYRGGSFGGIFERSQQDSAGKPQNMLIHRTAMDFDVWHRAT